MRRALIALVTLGLAVTVVGCSYTDDTPTPSGLPSIDPSLIPVAPPAEIVDVDGGQFVTAYGDYIFKVGQGPIWCSINTASAFVLCEQNEVTAQYETIPVPATCDFSYGYQVRLWSTKPADGEIADFPCAGGSYADPISAKVLNANERVSLNGFTCWVDDVTVRCENAAKNYIVLGPRAWALGTNS